MDIDETSAVDALFELFSSNDERESSLTSSSNTRDRCCYEEESSSTYDEVSSSNEASHTCMNCKRRYLEDIYNTRRGDIVSRQIFRFVEVCRNENEARFNDIVPLCHECHMFLSPGDDKVCYQYIWPSFVWKVLSSNDVIAKYGNYVWKFIPRKWRNWWLEECLSLEPYRNISLDYPTPVFQDITDDIASFNDDIASGSLGRLKSCINAHLMPTVLCPWGCTEYIHKCNPLRLDIIFQRYLPRVNLRLIDPTAYEKFFTVSTARDDYVRDDEYDVWLLNDEWKVVPSIEIVNGKGPFVLSCRCHKDGSSKNYLHCPRQPNHILPSKYGDQLCSIVTKTREVRPVKESVFSNTYQTFMQKGSIYGIDTCDVTNIGRFDLTSKLLAEAEARSICNRPDIVFLLQRLVKAGRIHREVASSWIKVAKESYPDTSLFDPYYRGSTYVPLDVAISLQENVDDDNMVKVTIDISEANERSVETKRNWPVHIFPCQKCDEYGAQFAPIPSMKGVTADCRLFWCLCSLLSRVKELWELTNSCELKESTWYGWVMLWISRECFHNLGIHYTTKENPFKLDKVKSKKNIVQKLATTSGAQHGFGSIVSLFEQHEGVRCFSRLGDVVNRHETLDDNVLIFDDCDDILNDNRPRDLLVVSDGDIFEFRCLICINNQHHERHWDGIVISNHGGLYRGKHWVQRREDKLAIHESVGHHSFLGFDRYIAVYVRTTSKDKTTKRNIFMRSIGGQCNVICREHALPLIRAKKDCRLVCFHSRQNTPNPCKKCFMVCPEQGCSTCLCKQCFDRCSSDNICHVGAIQEDSSLNDSIQRLDQVEEAEESEESEEDDYGLDEFDEFHARAAGIYNDELDESSVGDYEEIDSTLDNFVDEDYLVDDDNATDSLENHLTASISHMIPSTSRPSALPTTNAGEKSFEVKKSHKQGYGDFVDGHILLNGCASMLSRRSVKLQPSIAQRNFIQRQVSVSPDFTVSLLWIEAEMFPSIFWKSIPLDGSFAGALPVPLLIDKKQLGFATIHDHLKTRITSSSSTTSTNPKYIAFGYDMISNLYANHHHHELVLNRGLTVESEGGKPPTLTVRSKDDSALSDSTDSMQLILNLCAAQRFHKFHFFLTFTANMREHFGLSNIKKWIDGLGWTFNFPNYYQLPLCTRNEIRDALVQSASTLLQRNWMEVNNLFVKFLMHSEDSPYHPVRSVFVRKEYQDSIGNLPHIHMMLEMKTDGDDGVMSDQMKNRVLELIRASVCHICSYSEADDLMKDGVFVNAIDVEEMRELASKILAHNCSPRCQMKVKGTDDPSSTRCRKTDNLKISPDHTQHCFIKLPLRLTMECIDILIELGYAEPINDPEHFHPSDFRGKTSFFNPTKHIPPTHATHDLNISPVEGRTFAACRSMQNVQFIGQCNGVNTYVCKYLGKIDQSHYIVIRGVPHKDGILVAQSTFVHNSKVATSAYNEEKARQSRRSAKGPDAKAICVHEMTQKILEYQDVYTNIPFVKIPTLPLEERAGTWRFSDRCENNINGSTRIVSEVARRALEFPEWRCHNNSELLILEGALKSAISIDKITKFSLRPPELRCIDRVGDYFRWFETEGKKLEEEDLLSRLDVNMVESAWIDGLQVQIKIRSNALDECMTFIDNEVDPMYNHDTISLLRSINEMNQRSLTLSLREHEVYHRFVSQDGNAILPVPRFASIRPNLSTKFILHVLLSMGRIGTELDLSLQPSIRESFRYAKLIGPSNDERDLKQYSNNLLRMYIECQAQYVSKTHSVIGHWIVSAKNAFDSAIIRNEININDMPPALQSMLNRSKESEVAEFWQKMKRQIISSAMNEMGDAAALFRIPPVEELLAATIENPLMWDASLHFRRVNNVQSLESFEEQHRAVSIITNLIDRRLDISQSTRFVKSTVIVGAPGSGKTFINGSYIPIYAISKGLNVIITSLMSERSNQLGGIHLHRLFCIPVKMMSMAKIVEEAIKKIMKNPVKYKVLMMIDIMIVDEVGQVSSELFAILDRMLRVIRNSDIFMGGVLVLGTLDHRQLHPVTGKPFLTSSYIVSCYQFIALTCSVRANGDSQWQRIQHIVRLHPAMYTTKPSLLQELRQLLSECCTFVDNWDSHPITPYTQRIFGKRKPSKEAAIDFVNFVKRSHTGHLLSANADDEQCHQHSRQDFQPATDGTMQALDHKCKEPRELLFFIGAQYQITYNHSKDAFSHAQICMLLDLPTQQCLDLKRDVKVLLAPPGKRNTSYVHNKSKSDYILEGWKEIKIGIAPTRNINITRHLIGRRRQYGLKHHVTGTIHASMGATLPQVATEISMNESLYKLWDKAQIVVVCSRTKQGRDTIFVGDKDDTINAIVSLVQRKTQWMDYMENVLELGTIQGDARSEFNFDCHFPYRICDVELPSCMTGHVYMMVSLRDKSEVSIGKTKSLHDTLTDFNSGYIYNGEVTRRMQKYRPYCLFAFVTGFDNNDDLQEYILQCWSANMYRFKTDGPEVIARSIVTQVEALNASSTEINVRLCTLFKERW